MPPSLPTAEDLVPAAPGAPLEPEVQLLLLLADAAAGAPMTISVEGLVAGTPVARGTTAVTPAAGRTVEARVMLGSLLPGSDSGLDAGGLDSGLDAGADSGPGSTDAGRVCGDGVVEAPEQCDGIVPPAITCTMQTGGTRPDGMVICTGCFFDPSGCTCGGAFCGPMEMCTGAGDCVCGSVAAPSGEACPAGTHPNCDPIVGSCACSSTPNSCINGFVCVMGGQCRCDANGDCGPAPALCVGGLCDCDGTAAMPACAEGRTCLPGVGCTCMGGSC